MDKKIYNLIKERIVKGHYKPSQVINEKKLINELAVSRTPIRESLAKLEWEKLVNIVPRAGAIVSPIELGLIREVYQIRTFIEGLIGRLAIEKANTKHLSELSKMIETGRKIQKKGATRDDVIATDLKLRDLLSDAAGNKTLSEISDYLFNITIRVWYSLVRDDYFSDKYEMELVNMESLLSALKSKDAEKAEQTRRKMISEYVEELKRTFDF